MHVFASGHKQAGHGGKDDEGRDGWDDYLQLGYLAVEAIAQLAVSPMQARRIC